MENHDKYVLLMNMTDDSAEVTVDFLEQWGFKVYSIDRFDIEELKSSEIIPVLIIFQLLEFSWFEFEKLQLLRAGFPEIPIIATSPYVSIKKLIKIMKIGVDDYLTQPYSPNDLKEMIFQYIDARFKKESVTD